MFKEVFRYLTTPASQKAKRLGILNEIIALEFRSDRQSFYWAEHQQKCKDFIKRNLPHVSKSKSVMILGAGLGQEFDLAFLATTFKHVYLVDLILSHSLKTQISQLPNITFIECDLSGINSSQEHTNDFNNYLAPNLDCPPDLGLLVSCNLMSQLPLFTLRKNKYFLSLDEISQKAIEKELKKFHLTWISHFSKEAKVILLSDVAHYYFDHKSNLLLKEDHSSELFQKLKSEKWMWPMAPLGEISKDYSLHLEVWAIILNP